jgi:hypothetical protein
MYPVHGLPTQSAQEQMSELRHPMVVELQEAAIVVIEFFKHGFI